jgi:hypothetical protein
MKFLLALISALMIPVVLLNMLGCIVSGMWLVIIGQWGIVVLGILFYIASSFGLSFALVPALLLSAPAVYCSEKGKTIPTIFFITLSNLYVIAVITLWCCGILYLFAKGVTTTSLIPRLIWSYGVAVGPWAYMASKEQQSGEALGPTIAAFLAALAYVVIMIIVLFSRITLLQALEVFVGFMLVGLVFQTIMAYLIHKEEKEISCQLNEIDQ